jgi:hypothetical protein
MPFDVTGYTAPGAYEEQVVVASPVLANTVPFTVTLIGVGDRNQTSYNEAIVRGLIQNEAVTFTGAAGSRIYTTINHANRRMSQSTLFSNGSALPSDGTAWYFLPAAITTTANTAYVFGASTNTTPDSVFAFSMDGNVPIQVQIATPSGIIDSFTPTVNSNVIQANIHDATTAGSGATATISLTPAQLARAFNGALQAATASNLGLPTSMSNMGYGAAYATAAVANANSVTLTSVLTGAAQNTYLSNVTLYNVYPTANNASTIVWGALSFPYVAPSTIRIHDGTAIGEANYYSSTAVYTLNYVTIDASIGYDYTAFNPIVDVTKVGNFAGVSSYQFGIDYTIDHTDEAIDFGALELAPVLTGLPGSYNISTNTMLSIGFDNLEIISVQLNGLSSPPLGYVTIGSPTTATASQLAVNINSIFNAAPEYGPRYSNVATVSGTSLVLTSPTLGALGQIELSAPSANSATSAVLGIQTSQLPYSQNGTGASPAIGATYFATYDYVRPTDEYNTPTQYFSPSNLYQGQGVVSSENLLSLYGQICFANGAPSVFVIQTNDAVIQGQPTVNEQITAIDSFILEDATTELVVIDNRLQVQLEQFNQVNIQSGPIQKHYCRGWYGMAPGTVIGDADTPGSYVYMASVTLQTPPDSPGRGRHILVAPPQAKVSITNPDSSTSLVQVDGTGLAAAVASLMTSFTNPATALLNETVTGFDLPSFTVYQPQERNTLAAGGVCVVGYIGGQLKLTDPITTEAGGANVVQFSEPSASTQRDVVSRAVEADLQDTLVGIVPTDLSDFLTTIKTTIGLTLETQITAQNIAPFKDANGKTRPINYATDIVVFQSPVDPTKYYFQYYYNLRYPAKRFFGQYSVDNPFFSPSQGAGSTPTS